MPRKPRRIGIVLYADALALDVAGPAEAFAVAAQMLGEGHYELGFYAPGGGLIRTASGMTVDAEPLETLDPGRLDTLIVAGGVTIAQGAQDARVVQWVRGVPGRIRRICSVCTGAFVLAAAGLLDGRRAVTHWGAAEALRRRHPGVRVEVDPIYINDGAIWTSAGVTAGIDLALALIQEDHGRNLALRVARELVVFAHRPGGQAQFSHALAGQLTATDRSADERLSQLHDWILDNLSRDLRLAELAARAGMSPRTFGRQFAAHFGRTPAKHVETLRVDAARRYLEDADAHVKEVAATCGFGDEERMRRAFLRHLGVSPSVYRARFAFRQVA